MMKYNTAIVEAASAIINMPVSPQLVARRQGAQYMAAVLITEIYNVDSSYVVAALIEAINELESNR